ncbi:MAG TPA: sulfotransferase [Sphingomicrobium sp.]|jgi:tetratricopeptide (TPR) repeat protein
MGSAAAMVETAPDRTALASMAAAEARRRLGFNPLDAEAYRVLGRALRDLGEHEEANKAELAAIDASEHDPEIVRAAEAMAANDLPTAEGILRAVLTRCPGDVAGIRMLAEIGIRMGHPREGERLLRRAIELAPGFDYAHHTLAAALDMLSRSGEALAELNMVTGELADVDQVLALKAASLSKIGENEEALRLYQELAQRQPENVDIWISIANLQKIIGNPGTIDSYRKVLEISPTNGEAWWSLANLKTFRFSDEEVAAMKAALESAGLSDDDRFRLHFALGKALEDYGEDEAAFENYRRGNAIRAVQTRHLPAVTTELVDRSERLFTPEFFAAREGFGSQAPDPIFIVGMPRSGSTLIEQILASHPLVEGTAELPDVIVIARELEEGSPGGVPEGWRNYPDILGGLSNEDCRRLGETYLERSRVQRKTDRPFFLDKMPNNWMHVGLIRLMLPNAKVVDSRRHPLACGFSNFKQHYARGQEFSYDLEHFGLYYRDYVKLMAHFDRVAPGSVHRLIHEQLLIDPEAEIRKLLDYLELPFDEACLKFHETKRPVRTASAEQVRRPIDREGADYWKRFEVWLDPLKKALGPALENWSG